jgi:uncharacterized Tic20 family protein
MSYLREETNPDVTMWAMMCHLSSFAGVLIPLPFINIIAPWMVWMARRDDHPFIDDHGREVLNFQLSIAIYGVVATFLCVTVIGLVIGIPMFFVLWIVDIVTTIKGALRARDGYFYEYPMTIKFM